MTVDTSNVPEVGGSSFRPWSRWQDLLIALLGIWLFITPWVWPGPALQASASAPAYRLGAVAASKPYAASNPATVSVPGTIRSASYTAPAASGTTTASGTSWDSWIVGAIMFLVALWALSSPAITGLEWLNMIAAVWLFISPWVLGFYDSRPAISWNDWCVAVVVFFLAWFASMGIRSVRLPSGRPIATS